MNLLSQVIPHSVKLKTNSTFLHTRESVQNFKSRQTQISDSPLVKILDLDMLTYFIQEKETMHKSIGLILQQPFKTHQVKDSPMKAELTQKETELISSEMIKELTNSLNFSCQTDLSMDFLKQEWQDSINKLKHSFIAFLEHKSTSDHQSLVNKEAQRKLKENFSSSWKMQSDSLTCQKASKDFNLRLMRQKSGLILKSHQEHG